MAAESCSLPAFDWGIDPIVGESASMPLADCSLWVWCPCNPYDLLACERTDDSCPMDDICDDGCAGGGGWDLRCGDDSLGPPCFAGRFYGEVSIVCRCPSSRTGDDVIWDTTPETPEGYCAGDFPSNPPHPWTIPYGTFTVADQVPDTIFPEEACAPGSRSVWTWCPCTDNPDASYPQGAQPCPDDGTNCTANESGEGEWVFRGGCEQFGPPSVGGRFYGETIMVGYCCGDIIYDSVSSLAPSEESRSCPMPDVPTYQWDLTDGYDPPWDKVLDEGGGCMVSDDCSSWIWCQCEEDQEESCRAVWDTEAGCPDEGTAIDASDGHWQSYGTGLDHSGAPCIIGRFYGEIVWFCQCPVSSSSSSLSSSSLSSLSSSSLSLSSSSLSSLSSLSLTPPSSSSPSCLEVNFKDYVLWDLPGGGSGTGTAVIEDGGRTLRVTGNKWMSLVLPYKVTPDTVLEFTFTSSVQGEIHGIGFQNGSGNQELQIIQLYGTQTYGNQQYRDFGRGTTSYQVRVGDMYDGEYEQMVFAMDDDANSLGESVFSGLNVCERPPVNCVQLDFNEFSVVPTLGDPPDSIEIMDNGATLKLTGNGQARIALSTDIKATTTLEFDFKSTTQGEINGIGFPTTETANAARSFQVYGTQNWGLQDPSFTYSGSGGWEHFSIPVAEYLQDDAGIYMMFLNDDDGEVGAVSYYGNVVVCTPESSSSSYYAAPPSPYVFRPRAYAAPVTAQTLPDVRSGYRRFASDLLRDPKAAAIIYEKVCTPCESNVDGRCATCAREGCLQGNETPLRALLTDFDEARPLRNKTRLAAEHCPLWKW